MKSKKIMLQAFKQIITYMALTTIILGTSLSIFCWVSGERNPEIFMALYVIAFSVGGMLGQISLLGKYENLAKMSSNEENL